MISQGTLTVVLWGAYAWFVVGVVMIAVPALKELWNLLFKNRMIRTSPKKQGKEFPMRRTT